MSKEHKDLRHWVYYIYGSAVISIYMGVDGCFDPWGSDWVKEEAARIAKMLYHVRYFNIEWRKSSEMAVVLCLAYSFVMLTGTHSFGRTFP